MNKLGFASKPEKGDLVTVLLNNGEKINAQVINWGAEDWDQIWAVVKTADGLIQINLAQVSTYSIKKDSQDRYEIVEKAVDSDGRAVYTDDGERVKVARKVNMPSEHQYKIVRRGSKQASSITKTINDGEKTVKEPELYLDKSLAKMDPVHQAQALVDLYEQKRRLVSESVKDHLTSDDLKETKNNYAMPSFKKHTTSET
jgi:hypothetical protein